MAVKCILTGQEKVNLSGDTMTGDLKVGSSSIGINGYIEGTWLKTTKTTEKAGDFATIDGEGWLYKRKPTDVLRDIGGQAKITASGILKGDGTGNITAADETEVELVDLPQDIFLANDNTTNAEIETALSAGKLPVVVLADYYFYYTGRKSENYHAFMSFPQIGRYGYATCTNNNWQYVFEYGDIRDLVETISLPAASWVGSDPYTQTCPLKLYINDVSLAKADIQPSEELYDQLVADGVGYLAIKNVDGTFTAVAKGGKPNVDLTVQVTYNNVKVY